MRQELRLIDEHQDLFVALWKELGEKEAARRAKTWVAHEIYPASHLTRFAKERIRQQEPRQAKERLAMNFINLKTRTTK